MAANCQCATAARSGRHLSKLFWRNRDGVRKNNDNGVGNYEQSGKGTQRKEILVEDIQLC